MKGKHGEWKPDGFRARAFADENSRISLAMLLLREGEAEDTVAWTIMSLHHLGDPLILRNTESAVCAAQNTIAIAVMRLGRGSPISGDDDDD